MPKNGAFVLLDADVLVVYCYKFLCNFLLILLLIRSQLKYLISILRVTFICNEQCPGITATEMLINRSEHEKCCYYKTFLLKNDKVVMKDPLYNPGSDGSNININCITTTVNTYILSNNFVLDS